MPSSHQCCEFVTIYIIIIIHMLKKTVIADRGNMPGPCSGQSLSYHLNRASQHEWPLSSAAFLSARADSISVEAGLWKKSVRKMPWHTLIICSFIVKMVLKFWNQKTVYLLNPYFMTLTLRYRIYYGWLPWNSLESKNSFSATYSSVC